MRGSQQDVAVLSQNMQTRMGNSRGCSALIWSSKNQLDPLINAQGRSLFPLVSILSHSCSSNLEPVSNPTQFITLRAKIPIRAGEQLTMRYTHFMHSKWDIQAMLQKEWLFTCTCLRCEDATELGSYFSSLKCQCGGYFIQKISECQSVVCSKCNISKDFTDRFKKIQAIESNLTFSTVQKYVMKWKKMQRFMTTSF